MIGGSTGSVTDVNAAGLAQSIVKTVDLTPYLRARQNTITVIDAGGTFCQRQTPAPTFCADFDEGALLSGWTSTLSDPGSTVDLDVAESSSAPASLVAKLPGGSGGTRLYRTFPTSIGAAHVDFDLRIDRFDGSGFMPAGVCVLAVDMGPVHQLRLVTGALHSYLEEQRIISGPPAYQGYDLDQPIGTGAWVHVRVDLDTTAPPSAKTRAGA